MVRVKKGLTKHKSHKKILAKTKGYRGAKSKLLRTAKEALMHAGAYAFAGRKQRKRQKRRLWITKINAALKEEGIPYSQFLKGLREANINLDRKILADLAVSDPAIFKQIVARLKL
jgi:large subunit ribosomal protein L20